VTSSYWSYGGCVAMQGYVYGISLADGRDVKLQVLRYYGQGQETCDQTGSGGSDAAKLRVRWAFVD
jgi:hypothetical protein